TSGFDPPIHSSVVLNLDIRKTIFTFGDYGKANLKVAVRNITNEEYEFATPDSRSRYQYATMPGRSFYVALEYAY
ncbi:MAG: hypothetical protein LBF40_03250, partial [Deltaproteobacteria bacterium]|nr:hypothetical protein [Deltaproteobacteria bacterium]